MTSLDVTSAGMSPGEVGCKIREHGDDLAAFRRYLALAVLNPATVFRSFMLPVASYLSYIYLSGSRSGSSKVLKTDPVWIRILNTGREC